MVDNIDNNPSSTTADIFSQHKYVLSFENEGKMWMLSESVDMSTWKYGVSACRLHTLSSSALPATRTVYALVARTLQTSHLEEMESYDRVKGGIGNYIHSAGNSTHHK